LATTEARLCRSDIHSGLGRKILKIKQKRTGTKKYDTTKSPNQIISSLQSAMSMCASLTNVRLIFCVDSTSISGD
jgi:hypothetical protein